jgi:hypothetical protein
VDGLFSLETISFVVQKLFNFMKPHLSILSLSCWAAGVVLRKSLPIPVSSRVFPAPSFNNFRVSGLMFRSLIHFELTLVQGDRHGSSFSFLQMDNHFSQQHLLRGCLFSIVCLRNPKPLLVGMQAGTTTLEKNLEAS